MQGASRSRISGDDQVACIQSPAVRDLVGELLRAHMQAFPETAGFLIYTQDELAEVCDEQGAAGRHQRQPEDGQQRRIAVEVLDEQRGIGKRQLHPTRLLGAVHYQGSRPQQEHCQDGGHCAGGDVSSHYALPDHRSIASQGQRAEQGHSNPHYGAGAT
jgi:hypothetical protein